MTVSSTLNRIEYDGNGATALFPFPIYFLAAEDLKVYLRDELGGESLKAHAIDYAISGQGDPAGGAVSFFAPPLPGEKVVILRDPPLTQTTDYQANDTFPAETHERALDKLTMQVQRVAERVDRSVTLEETATDGEGAYDFGGNRIASMGVPVAGSDAATKGYVDAVAGLVSTLSGDESFLAIGPEGVGGTADAIMLTSGYFPAVPTGLVKARFTPKANNTGPVTVTISDGGTPWADRNLVDADGDALEADALIDDIPVEIVYSAELDKVVLLGFYGAAFAAEEVSDTLGLSNLGLSVGVATNTITIALKTAAGTDATADDKIKIGFRHATATSGQTVVREIAAAQSLTISSGSALGFSSSQMSRLYVVGLDATALGGGVELAVWHPLSGINLKALSEANLHTTTAEGGAGGADAAQVLYSMTARANVPVRILGYFEIATGATAGEWGNAPTKVQVMGPGVPRTGDVVQEVSVFDGEVATGTTAMLDDDTIPQNNEGTQFMSLAVTPTSAMNLLQIEALAHVANSSIAITTAALFQDAVADALKVGTNTGGASGWKQPHYIRHRKVAGTAAATTFKVRAGGTAGTATFNGNGSARKYGGAFCSHILISEFFV